MNPCEECALRLFNKKHHNLSGVGNPLYGNMIVVPNVDYDAYVKGDMSFSKQVEIINDCISSTGVLDNIFIAPLIRCNSQLGCDVNRDIINLCVKYLIQDIHKYNIRNLLCLGDAARIILKCNPGEYLDYIITPRTEYIQRSIVKNYNVNYSPLIKYTDAIRYEWFKKYLNKWYNYAVHNFNSFNHIIEI